jgi:agmatine deiminase
MNPTFRMPAEWSPHRATWIAWPHNKEDWPGKFEPIPWVYAEIVRVLTRHERVGILTTETPAVKSLLKRVGVDLKKVDFLRCPTDRVWTRDSGPIFVKDAKGQKVATHWKFNGWAKYPNHKKDDLVPTAIAKFAGVPERAVVVDGREIVMEGGAIDVDGAGLLMCTEECLLSKVQGRNPGLGRAGTEKVLKETLGASRIVWLGKGIVGDDTHGHVDDIARFVGPSKVVLCREDNVRDPNYRICADNYDRLIGEKIEVIDLPMPAPIVFERQRLPASYANFYVANGVVIVPTFNDPKDRQALGILSNCFPDREVVGIHCVDFVWGLGTLHCATQQEPA